MKNKTESEAKTYGKATVGKGTADERELDVITLVQLFFANQREIHVAKMEKEQGFILSVISKEQGNESQQTMFLTANTLANLANAVFLFFNSEGANMSEIITGANNDVVKYFISENLNNPFKTAIPTTPITNQ